MADLLDLPEEILIFIIKLLDIKSAYNLYKTCQTMKTIILMKGVIRVCNFSLSTLATPKSLQLGMIKHIASHLYELNMCGVSKLRKSLLLPAVTSMKCLKTLDVSFTNITILDFLDIYRSCPTINSISINFYFKSSEDKTIPDQTLLDYQEVFKNFVNVHFVTRTWLGYLPLSILAKSSLNTFKYTVCDWKGRVCQCRYIDKIFPFKHFCIYMLDWGGANQYAGTWNQLLPLVKLDNTEFIVMEYDTTTYSICTSSRFVNFFSENFNITPFSSIDLNKEMRGNIAILIWNNEATVFDEIFYINLKKRITSIFTCELEVAGEQSFPFGIDMQGYDWFSINTVKPFGVKSRKVEAETKLKKKKKAPTWQVLDYDKILCEHEYVKLSVYISLPGIVTLSPNSSYLRKITYLSLAGTLVNYSNEFFNVLFRCCENLITLNVEASSLSPCCSPIMRSIPLSQGLKNIRLLDKRIDFKMLFSSFSQCKTLENICLVDSSTEFNNVADPVALYQMCPRLYNLYIRAAMTSSIEIRLRTMVNASLKKYGTDEHHINFAIFNACSEFNEIYHIPCFSYDPYLHVFNLKPIKPV